MRKNDDLDRIEDHARSEFCCDFWAPARLRGVLLDLVVRCRRLESENAARAASVRRLRKRLRAARRR